MTVVLFVTFCLARSPGRERSRVSPEREARSQSLPGSRPSGITLPAPGGTRNLAQVEKLGAGDAVERKVRVPADV